MKEKPISLSNPTWLLMDVLKSATDFLKSKSIENPRLNAEQLLAHSLQMDRMSLYLQFDRPLTQQERDTYKNCLRRRAENEPLQYIIGQTEFMSLPFTVTPEVLIPRPETETLVEAVAEIVKKEDSVHILDIGTGSGIIAVSLAHYLPNADLTAIDISDSALAVAKQNATLNQVDGRIRFFMGDVMGDSFLSLFPNGFDVVVSNPPYVTKQEFEQLPEEIRKHEPKEALTDHGDGLDFYRKISEIGHTLVKPDGVIFVEVGDTQSQSVQLIFAENQYQTIQAIKDLNGIERVIKIIR